MRPIDEGGEVTQSLDRAHQAVVHFRLGVDDGRTPGTDLIQEPTVTRLVTAVATDHHLFGEGTHRRSEHRMQPHDGPRMDRAHGCDRPGLEARDIGQHGFWRHETATGLDHLQGGVDGHADQHQPCAFADRGRVVPVFLLEDPHFEPRSRERPVQQTAHLAPAADQHDRTRIIQNTTEATGALGAVGLAHDTP